MKNRLKPILAFFGLVMLIIIVSLIPELVGGDIADALKQKLGDKYYYVIGGIGLITLLAYTYWSEGSRFFGGKSKDASPEQVSQDNLQKIRSSLLESYQRRIDNKLASRFPINIEVMYTREGSPTKGHLYNKSLRISDLKKELIEIFDKQQGRLLIIGEPGAGKTTLLLQLAIKLFERGEAKIPFIINIATWRSRFSTVEDWLQELLPQMGFSKALANQILAEKRLLPLFDGLDELVEEQRPIFLAAIAEYGTNNEIKYVICSRVKEYAQTTDAAVNGQVMVKPLTLLQIEQGLKEIQSHEANGILGAIKKDPLLAEAITNPFYLNTIQFLFASKKTWEELAFASNNLAERKQEIIDKFLRNTINHFLNYSMLEVKKWLSFLVNRMNRNELVTFELVKLQYDWCFLNNFKLSLIRMIEGIVIG